MSIFCNDPNLVPKLFSYILFVLEMPKPILPLADFYRILKDSSQDFCLMKDLNKILVPIGQLA